ncbi:type VI secretion protein IcmF/TssM N-terminal domain-containing protein [Aureimonas pseudogalii]|uniref:Type VI protein secretion system component VasK n=1 Tax=Aureimonas pseudogalii TaxID=1744844 RepID=A0A7W6H8K2_9HYPH|nr:type VI secretion protein IcmF/TssM N-terminal domain-containing protein [Aureimonas pseudogalii]MBB4000421.1 type VI protein secretion system component VasK [Aureimonas pseudogalii]
MEIASVPAEVERLAAFLRRFRPACPINGVILAVSPADLTLADALERREIGEGLAASLAALETQARSRPPVYVALTKIDLAPGFLEGFEALEPGERHQSWGFSFPLSLRDGAKTADVVEAFHAGVRSLVEATRTRLLDALARVDDPLRGGRLIGFGAQVAAMDPIVDTVLRPILPSDIRRRKGAFLRGVYLTSSQQDALTIDALLPELAARYAMPRSGTLPDIEVGDAEHGFFVAGLLRDAVIREAGLVGMARPPWYRRPIFGVLILTVCVCLSLLGAVTLRLGFDRAESRIERVETQLSRLDTAVLSSRDASDDVLSRVAETTDRIGRLNGLDELGILFRPFPITDLRREIATAHETALRNSLGPHLTARLARDLADLGADRDTVALRLAAASPDAQGHAAALGQWLEQTAAALPGGGTQASFLHESPAALSLAPARPDPVYLDVARRILAWKDSQP